MSRCNQVKNHSLPGKAPLTSAGEPLPLGEPEQQPEAEVRGVGTGLPAGAKGEEKELVDSILFAQAPPEQAPMTSATFAPMEPMAPAPMEPMAPAPMEPMAPAPMESNGFSRS
jgi:hypothetical protein